MHVDFRFATSTKEDRKKNVARNISSVCDQICSFEPCSVYLIRERDDDDLLDDELSTMFQVNQGDRLRLHEQILLPVFWLTVRLIVRFA